MDSDTVGWAEVADLFQRFSLFVDSPEMRWFKKAWQGFVVAGKASYEDDVQRHWVLARAVTLGVMFLEFAERAWDEKDHIESALDELRWNDIFNLIRLGNMVEADHLSDDGNTADLFVEAMGNLICRCRLEVYDSLVKVFGDPTTLFVSLWLCHDEDVKVGHYSDESFENTVNHDLTGQKQRAFNYVANGMFD